MKKFLSLICFLYAGIIIYVWHYDLLLNFLAPTLALYIKISLLPILIMGLVLLINKTLDYKFKISDLVLLLPLAMMVLAGDGRLTVSLASNRMFTNTSAAPIVEEVEENIEEIIIPEAFEKKEEKNNTFEEVDFEIIDETYEYLTSYMNSKNEAYNQVGKTIRVRGFIVKNDYMPEGYFAIGKYSISCCVADASFAGFISKYDTSKVIEGKWYEIEGVIAKGKTRDGYDMIYIDVANIKEIDKSKEKQYVYPCYNYDDSCSALMKYNLY